MNLANFIIQLPPWLLFTIIVVLSVGAALLGNWFANFRKKKGITGADGPIGTAVASLLSLLAFMLAFIFSLTATRFGDRKDLVIQQANAIGTCYLRAGLLPEKQKTAVRILFREYVNILANDLTGNKVEPALGRVEELNLQLWQQAVSVSREDMDSEIRALFIDSLNQVIDLAAARKTVALIFQIPGILWISLLLLAALGMFAIGYQAGFYGTTHLPDFILLGAAFALVIVLIADMDSSGIHHFKVSQQPILDLQEMMRTNVD